MKTGPILFGLKKEKPEDCYQVLEERFFLEKLLKY